MSNVLRIKSGAAVYAVMFLLLMPPTNRVASRQAAQPTASRISNPAQAASTLSAPLIPAWRLPNVGAINFAPVGSSGMAHLALAGGEMVAVQTATGAVVWRDQFGGEICAQPVSDGAGVFVATRNGDKSGSAANAKGSLRLVGAATGLTRWVRELSRPLTGTLSITETHVFAVDAGDNILAFDKITGAPTWFAQMSSSVTTPLANGDGMLYVGIKEGAICALDSRTGRVVWRREVNRKQPPTSIGADGSRLYIGANDGHVYAVGAASGDVMWRKRLSGTIEHLAPIENGVLAFSRASVVYSFEARRGGRVWKRQLPGRLISPPIVDGGVVAVSPLSAGSCFVIDTRTGKTVNVIEVRGEAIVRSSFVDGKLLLLIDDVIICYASASATDRKL